MSLEGRLLHEEGPAQGVACGPGEFVWRSAGSRHSAWMMDGGMTLEMFQIPNKFYELDGRVTDLSGTDWADIWGGAAQA